MNRSVGVGFSEARSAKEAAVKAIKEATSGMDLSNGQKIGFLFASPRYDLAKALEAGGDLGVDLIGCSTSGELTNSMIRHGSVSCLVLSNQATGNCISFHEGLELRSAQEVAIDIFSSSQLSDAGSRDFSTSIFLSDGVFGKGENLLKEYKRLTRPNQQFAGGASGAEGQFRDSAGRKIPQSGVSVGGQVKVESDSLAAAHISGPVPWGIGIGIGLKPSGESRLVTKSDGNTLFEINQTLAATVYREYFESRGHVPNDQELIASYIENPLGKYEGGSLSMNSAIHGDPKTGSLTMISELNEGDRIDIFSRDTENMLAAARAASIEARDSLSGAKPAAILIFSCVCRSLMLGSEVFQKELDGIRSVFPGVPAAGFITYGEILGKHGSRPQWQNASVIVAAIPDSNQR